MRNGKILLKVSLALLFLASVFFFVSAASAQENDYSIVEQQITTSGKATNPDIYGNKIVYVTASADNYPQGIYVHDVSTGREDKISDDVTSMVAICDDMVAWAHVVNSYQGYNDICIRYISNGDIVQITTDNMSSWPDIYGGKIVYSNGTHPWIYLYDISSGEKIELADYGNIPSIYGDKVAYQSNYNAYLCDIIDRQPQQLSSDGHTNYVKIYGDKVVLEKSAVPAIVMYDINTGETLPIADQGQQVDIDGDRIVWNNNGNIYMFSNSDGQTVQITASGHASEPAIYGDKIVWTDSRAGPGIVDIYMATVTAVSELTPTKKVAVVLAKFSDSGIIYSPDRDVVENRCDLIQQYYFDQSYGAEYIAFDIYNASTEDGWYQLTDTEEQGKQHLLAKDKKEWSAAYSRAGIDMTKYDTVMVIFPVEFDSYAWRDSSYALCDAHKGYGNWAHELGHSLYGLKDKYSIAPIEGDIGEWGLMGYGWKYNPPAPLIGFDREKKGWLNYNNISESGISISGKEYTMYTLSDISLKSNGILCLKTDSSAWGYESLIFEGRKSMDGVPVDSLMAGDYPFSFGKESAGIEIYDIDRDGKIWREPAEIKLVSTDVLYYMNLNNLGVTIFPDQSKKIAGGRLKASCFLEGNQLKLKIEKNILENIKIYCISTAGLVIQGADLAENDGNLDVDLHIKTSEGEDVGMNYQDNIYVINIAGAETSGNLMGGGPEWISVPKNTEVTAYITISPDLRDLLERDSSAFVEVKSVLEIYDESGKLQETKPFDMTITGADIQDSYEIPLKADEPEPILPVANFTANVTEGHHPLDVQLISTSTDVTGYQWNFGDGSENVTIADPVHTFTGVGTFDVVLTASNDNGTSSKNMSIIVTKSAAELKDKKPVADFRADIRRGLSPLTVQFNDSSEHKPSSWSWDFGDGSEPSIEQNPVHVYANPGEYTVNLTVSNEVGTDYKRINQFIIVEDADS